MDDNISGTPFQRMTRKEEDLFSAIIEGFLKDKFELEIYPKEISIKDKANPHSIEIFFPFGEDDIKTEKPEYPED